MLAQIIADFGAVDHLVNNAGVQFVAPIAAFPEDDWDRVRGVVGFTKATALEGAAGGWSGQ